MCEYIILEDAGSFSAKISQSRVKKCRLDGLIFSKNERNKVLSVLDLLSEAGTLDELGIAD